ncbi:MAG: ribonuclease HII [Acidobacteriota bacterium]
MSAEPTQTRLFETALVCDFAFENFGFEQGFHRIAGLDEVGRGALFGPVCAAAVILNRSRIPAEINDSKQLSAKKRLELAERIKELAEDFAVAFVEAEVIDQVNVLEATRQAMKLAVARLKTAPDYLLCDGPLRLDTSIPQRSVIKGDARSQSIAAASIVAKVERDLLISRLALQYPEYDLANNKGYPTPKHLRALRRHGATPLHRKSFRGVQS